MDARYKYSRARYRRDPLDTNNYIAVEDRWLRRMTLTPAGRLRAALIWFQWSKVQKRIWWVGLWALLVALVALSLSQ